MMLTYDKARFGRISESVVIGLLSDSTFIARNFQRIHRILKVIVTVCHRWASLFLPVISRRQFIWQDCIGARKGRLCQYSIGSPIKSPGHAKRKSTRHGAMTNTLSVTHSTLQRTGRSAPLPNSAETRRRDIHGYISYRTIVMSYWIGLLPIFLRSDV